MRRVVVVSFAVALAGCGTEPTREDNGTTNASSSPTTEVGTTETETSADSETAATQTDADSRSDADTDAQTDTASDLDCDEAAFAHAPPPTVVDGLLAVPIDILDLDAALTFTVGSSTAVAEASVQFQVGPSGGMPVFDLRQALELAVLDDDLALDPQALTRRDFGHGVEYGFRVLAHELAPCSVHTLHLEYALATPDAPDAGGLSWAADPGRVYFDTWLSDLNPGRYIESWLPANLPYDTHTMTVEVRIEGAGAEHLLITNADVDALDTHHWQLDFPETTAAMSPLVVLVPSEEVDVAAGVHRAANGQAIPYTLVRQLVVPQDLATLEAELLDAVDEFVLSTGPFVHPRLTGYVGIGVRSMEYDGAFTTEPGALKHEAFHSWWARGVRPATYADGWIDEAWDVYNTAGNQSFTAAPLDFDATPVALYDPDPWARDTPDAAYSHGRALFSGLAAIVGVDPLRTAMASIYVELGPLAPLTTDALERHLYCQTGAEPQVWSAFWRFVRGEDGDAPAVSADYCD